MNKKNLIIAVSLSLTIFTIVVFRNVKSNAYSSAFGMDGDTTGLAATAAAVVAVADVNQSRKPGIDKESDVLLSNSVSKKIIRLHVIANSDSEEDQAVKLKIRDAVLENMGTKLEQIKSRQESFNYLKQKLPLIENIANSILYKDKQTYTAKAYLGEFEFPIKSYGEITLPQGKYTALRIVLGNGEGKNWWCVMFPPLCFIDITRGLACEESNKELGKVLDKKELVKITNKNVKKNISVAQNTSDANKKSNIKIRFKTVDFIKNIFNQ